MTITLDHHQRLNLTVLLGLQECRTLQETRRAWKLIDLLTLDDDEKRTIDFTVRHNGGSENYSWNPEKTLPVREYDLSDSEVAQLEKAISGCPRFIPGQMRGWLEPLLAQLPEPVEANGNKP